MSDKKSLVSLSLSKDEIHALFDTANQMATELEYYKYKGEAEYKIFVKAYESGMEKLRKASKKAG